VFAAVGRVLVQVGAGHNRAILQIGMLVSDLDREFHGLLESGLDGPLVLAFNLD